MYKVGVVKEQKSKNRVFIWEREKNNALVQRNEFNMKFYDFHNDVSVSDGSNISEGTLLIQKS